MKSIKALLILSSFSAAAIAAACSSSSSDLTLGDDSLAGNDSGAGPDGTIVGTDSGPGDDGSTPTLDAGSDARAEPDCTGIAYCDNFEDYADASTLKNNDMLGPWKINVSASDAGPESMSVDTVKPYGGLRSLHIQVPNHAYSSTHLLTQTKAAGLVGNNLFGRAMVYYAGSKPNGHTWVWQGIGASTESGDNNVSLNIANAGTNYFVNYHGTPNDAGAESSANGGTPAQDKWVCLQWEYDASGATPADDVKVWADTVKIIDSKVAPIQDWQIPDPVTTMQLGWVHYPQTTEAIDLYIDDFALNNAMIACPP